MIKLVVFMIILSINALAQEPTIVFGASELPDKQKDSFMITQPENAPNPLGNPIVYVPNNQDQEQLPVNVKTPQKNLANKEIYQTEEQNPKPFSTSPQSLKNQIENTLYQGGDRIYDVQSYPIQDINKITEPNIQPTITTYPEY